MKRKNIITIVLAILGAIILFVGVPLIINECYKANCGYITVWDGADILEYYGTILGAAIGIYSFTTEGKQLYDIIGCTGCRGVFEIIKQYLNEREIDYRVVTNE